MVMPWFGVLAALVGLLGMRTARLLRHELARGGKGASVWGLRILGWLPFLIWLINCIWPQN